MDVQSPEKNSIALHSLAFFLLVSIAYFSELHGQREAKVFLGEIYLYLTLAFAFFRTTADSLKISPALPAKLIIFFFVLSIASVLDTKNIYWSTLGTIQWSCFFIIFLLPQITRGQTKSLAPYFIGPIVAAAAVSLFAIINYYGIHFDPVIETLKGRGRVISTFGNPNYLSAFLGPVIPLTIYQILKADRRRNLFIVFFLYSVILTALFYAKTRGVLIGLTVALGMSVATLLLSPEARGKAFKLKKRIVSLSLISLTIILFFYGAPPFSATETRTIIDRFTETGASLQARFMMWGVSAEMISEHPFNGSGLGTYAYIYPDYQGIFLDDPEHATYREYSGWAHHAHNEYLHIAAETGAPTLMVFLLAIGLYLFAFIRKVINQNNIAPSLALTSAIAVTLIHSLVSFPLRLMPSATLFWLLLGLLSVELKTGTTKAVKIRLPQSGSLKTILAAMAIIISLISSSLFISDRYLGAGIRSSRDNNLLKAKKEFERSLAFNPWSGRALEQLGSTLTTLKRTDEGLQRLLKSEKYTKSELLYVKFASNSLTQGKLKEAIGHYKKGLFYYPNNYFMTMSLGIVAKRHADSLRKNPLADEKNAYLNLALLQLLSAKTKIPPQKSDLSLLNAYIKSTANEILASPASIGSLPKASPFLVISKEKLPINETIQKFNHNERTYIRDFIYGPGMKRDALLPKGAEIIKGIKIGDGWLREYSVST